MSHSPKSMTQPRAFAAMASLAILGLVGFVLPACAGEKSVAAKPAAAAAAADKNTPVAEVNGKPVTMADLETMLAPQLAKLEQDRQKLLEQGLDRLVEQKLMETEAAARGIDVLALQQAEIQGKIGEVTDAEVATWYQENQARIQGRPLEQIAPQIKQFLIQQRGQAAQEAFITVAARQVQDPHPHGCGARPGRRGRLAREGRPGRLADHDHRVLRLPVPVLQPRQPLDRPGEDRPTATRSASSSGSSR